MKRKSITLASALLLAVTIIISLAIFKDWENFKRGLQGAPPIEKVDNKP